MLAKLKNLCSKNKDFYKVILVFILLLLILVRLFWVYQKDYLYEDDPASFIIATQNYEYNGTNVKGSELYQQNRPKFNFKIGEEYTGKDLQQFLFANDGSIKSLVQDLKKLYLIKYDGSRANIYYILFRLYTNNFQDVNLHKMIFTGCSLNFWLFLISFFVMYKFLQLVITDKKYIPVGLFLGFINTAAISATLIIRDYQFQMLGCILANYIFAKLYLHVENYKNLDILSFKNMILTALRFGFFILTGYYDMLYMGLLFLVFLFHLYKNKILFKKDTIIKISSVIFMAFAFCFIVDPNYLSLHNNVDYSVKAPLTGIERVMHFKFDVTRNLGFITSSVFYVIFIIYALALLLLVPEYKKTKNVLLLTLFSVAMTWTIIVLIVAPLEIDLRYFTPAAPILMLGVINFLQGFKFKHTIVISLIYLLGAFVCNTTFNYFDKVTYFRPYLYFVHDHLIFNHLNLHSEIPMIFSSYSWTFPIYVSGMNDDAKVIFLDYIPDKTYKYKRFVMYYNSIINPDVNLVTNSSGEDILPDIKAKNNVVKTYCTTYGNCYVLVDNSIK